MTPAARIAAAIDILDASELGLPVEQALTRWARKSRFAGSKDRAAVRDHVFDVMRIRQTAAALGAGNDGRALMIGLLTAQGQDLDALFSGDGYAPPPLSDAEKKQLPLGETGFHWNLPDWLIPEFKSSLGDKAQETAKALQSRAPITLRVNRQKATRREAAQVLAADGIETIDNTLSDAAVTIVEGARKLRTCDAYNTGIVEIQDASSQAVVDLLPAARKCLDYCAGGGGKSLAMAAQPDRQVFAHDSAPTRMKDIALRADRAGVTIEQLSDTTIARHAPYDLVLCDVPCSGSGAWRRSPEAKWEFTPDRLSQLIETQVEILSEAAAIAAPSGDLIYATCSVLKAENEDQIARFLQHHPTWRCSFEKRIDVTTDGDGFYTAHLTQVSD